MKFLLNLLVVIMFSGSAFGQIVILLGAPASGKGTQAKFITNTLNLKHISTGDLLRENIKNQTALGLEAKTYMEIGKLVPDELVLNMLFDLISKSECQKGYLLDGFPRTLAQAEAFDKMIGRDVKYTVINIEVPDDVLLQRIAGRQLLEGRADDTQEIARERLNVYKEQTKPLVAYYIKKGVLFEVDGNKDIKSVQDDITNILYRT